MAENIATGEADATRGDGQDPAFISWVQLLPLP